MRAEHASLTAQIVALSRALAAQTSVAIVRPEAPVADALLPRAAQLGLHALTALGATEFATRASLGFVDHIALRAAILDHALERACRAGVEQVVILGAGLDDRAHRLSCLEHADVYEVDHPSSQRAKRARAASLPLRARTLTYVPVDFERERLADRLAQRGHDAQRRSAFLLEGVVPYLTRPALQQLFTQVRTASAPHSELLLTYVPKGERWLSRARPLIRPIFSVIGEPLRSPLHASELYGLLHEAGLSVDEDTGPATWAYVVGAMSRGRRLVTYERLVRALAS